jgi:hypothetical protein
MAWSLQTADVLEQVALRVNKDLAFCRQNKTMT